MALNLGHTFGRALEAAEDYTINHGRAVAIGLMLQAQWGVELGFVSAGGRRSPQAPAQVRRPANGVASQHDQRTTCRQDAARQEDSGRVVRFVFQRGIGDIQTFEDGSVARPADIEEILKFLVQVRR
jgi:3-dehydroquinate synthase